MLILKSAREIELMRQSGMLATRIMDALITVVRPGISTGELDRIVEEEIRRLGGVPILKGYQDFPSSLCVSVNQQVLHGIPSYLCLLRTGDIVSLDLGLSLNGWCTDLARTVPVGKVSREDLQLIVAAEIAFEATIPLLVPNTRISDIGGTISETIDDLGFSTVISFGGHGVGRNIHEGPSVPNYRRLKDSTVLVPGMVLAIEPMAAVGSSETIVESDGWTVVTADGSRASHYENTVAITEDGPLLLTVLG